MSEGDGGSLVLGICLAYLGIALAVGLWSVRSSSQTVEGFVTGDRNMNGVLLYFVVGAAVFSSFAFLGAPGWAYQRGMASVYIISFGILGMLPMYFLGPRARQVGIRHGFVTQAQMLGWRFESTTLQVLLGLLSIVVFIPYLTLQMKGAGLILNTVSEGLIPIWGGAALTYGVVVLYVVISGVMGVGWTNAFQGAFMMCVAWGLGLYLPFSMYGGVEPMFRAIEAAGKADMLVTPGLTASGEPWTWAGFSSFVLISAIGFSCWPHLFMKAFTARSDRALKMTVVMYPTFQAFLVPILLIGFAAILAFPGVEPADRIVPYMLMNLDIPVWLIGVVCAATLAASMSSGDTILHAAASVGVVDAVQPLRRNKLSDQTQRLLIRCLVLVIAGISFFFAVNTGVSIVGLLAGAYGGVAQIMPALVAAFYCHWATRAGVTAGLAVGIMVNCLMLVFPEWKPWPVHEGVYGLAANIAVLVLMSLRGGGGRDRAPDFQSVKESR